VNGRIRLIEKSNDLIGKRTRDLPACSIVPQYLLHSQTQVSTCPREAVTW
jgi:hypothetical protein